MSELWLGSVWILDGFFLFQICLNVVPPSPGCDNMVALSDNMFALSDNVGFIDSAWQLPSVYMWEIFCSCTVVAHKCSLDLCILPALPIWFDMLSNGDQ